MKNIIKNRYISFILALLMIVGVFLPHGGALAKDVTKKVDSKGTYNINIDINVNGKDKLSQKHDEGTEDKLTLSSSSREVKVYKLKVEKDMPDSERLQLASTYDSKTIQETEKALKEQIEKSITPGKSKLVYDDKLYEKITIDKKKDSKLDNLKGERIVVEGLDAGYYLIKETDESRKIPNKKLVTQVVKLPNENMKENILNINIKSVEDVHNDKIVLIKVDEDNPDIKLNQVEFELYRKDKDNNDKVVTVNGNTGVYMYKENGETSSLKTDDNGKIVVENLPEGNYYFKEKTPHPGYDKSNENKISEVVTPGKTVTVKNKITPILRKVDATDNNKYLEGAVFKLYKKDGTVLKFNKTGIYYEVNNSGKEEIVTDGNGAIYISELDDGEYYIKETTAPEGYKLTDKKTEFKVKDSRVVNDKGNVKVLPVENTPITPGKPKTPTGGFNFVKIDSTKKENRLAGAKFILMKKEGTTYKKYLKDGKEVRLTSPSNGEFSVSGLEYGEYALKEIEAPKNYTIDTELTPFKVDAASSSLPATKIVNKPFTPITTTSRQNTITTKYTPSDLTRVIKNPRTIVKTGDIRIIIMAVAGIILLILGIRLVNSDKRTQRA